MRSPFLTRFKRRLGMSWIRIELFLRSTLAQQLPRFFLKDGESTLVSGASRIAFNLHPVLGSWGGGNQWLLQFSRFLASRGCSVCFSMNLPCDFVFIVDPNPSNQNFMFGLDQIASAKARHPALRCIHRINECDARKGTEGVDALLAKANAYADYTVFVSSWLRDHHAERWFERANPHRVIVNGADPSVFHPLTTPRVPEHRASFRIVTHHWSEHWNKGFHEYLQVDEAIASGRLPNCELWIIGRWPSEIRWKSARTFGPHQGRALAALLQQCDLYITASRWEPGAMHYVEGAQCGLPVVYHKDTGGAPEVVSPYGVEFDSDPVPAILSAIERLADLRQICAARGPSGRKMCLSYWALVQRLGGPVHAKPQTESSAPPKASCL